MNAKLLLMSVAAFTVMSCITTFTSYFYYTKPLTLDAEFVYRGWPLCWMTESWSYWTGPPYPHQVSFQLTNFIIDFVFYAIVFQVPSQLYLYSRESENKRWQTSNLDENL